MNSKLNCISRLRGDGYTQDCKGKKKALWNAQCGSATPPPPQQQTTTQITIIDQVTGQINTPTGECCGFRSGGVTIISDPTADSFNVSNSNSPEIPYDSADAANAAARHAEAMNTACGGCASGQAATAREHAMRATAGAIFGDPNAAVVADAVAAVEAARDATAAAVRDAESRQDPNAPEL